MTRIVRSIASALLLIAVPMVGAESDGQHWVGTWAASAQHWSPGRLLNFRNQTVRLIVHTSIGGSRARIRVSNTYGDLPLQITAAHIARRAAGAEIDPSSDRTLTFDGKDMVTVPAHAIAISDPVDLEVPALSDLAISFFFGDTTLATTSHALAQQTNYVSPETGDATGDAKFTVSKTILAWPFLTGVDVVGAPNAFSVVALGSSLTDGDGANKDMNRRWPDVLAERLQKCNAGVLNAGIIGNRLMSDLNSPRQKGGPFGPVFEDLGPVIGESGVARFDRDILQSGARYVVLALGVNDILFPGAFIPASEAVNARQLIDANLQLRDRAHKKGMRAIITTIPPFEGAVFRGPVIYFSTPEKEKVRQEVNAWIRSTHEFDGMIDFDAPVRDPGRPQRLLPEYDSGDHVHPNDAGYVATGDIVPLSLFGCGE